MLWVLSLALLSVAAFTAEQCDEDGAWDRELARLLEKVAPIEVKRVTTFADDENNDLGRMLEGRSAGDITSGRYMQSSTVRGSSSIVGVRKCCLRVVDAG